MLFIFREEMKVDYDKRPGKRPILVMFMAVVSVVYFILISKLDWWWYSELKVKRIMLILLFSGHSVILSGIMCIWSRIKRVVYANDWLRSSLKVYSVILILAIALAIVFYILKFFFEYGIFALILELLAARYVLPVLMILAIAWIPMCDAYAAEWILSPIEWMDFIDPNYGFEPEPSAYHLYLGSTHSSTYDDYSSYDSSFDNGSSSGWTSMTDDYYGMHGEFDTNDRMRAYMEDMEQMSHDDGFDPHDHGYDWDEISDARNDGYL